MGVNLDKSPCMETVQWETVPARQTDPSVLLKRAPGSNRLKLSSRVEFKIQKHDHKMEKSRFIESHFERWKRMKNLDLNADFLHSVMMKVLKLFRWFNEFNLLHKCSNSFKHAQELVSVLALCLCCMCACGGALARVCMREHHRSMPSVSFYCSPFELLR